MAIKFIPSSDKVQLVGQEAHEAELKSLLTCAINGIHRVELQLEKLTDDKIDSDDGRLM